MNESSPHLHTYALRLLDLHRRIRAGQGNSPEADSVRDVMDAHWNGLVPAEIDRVRGLSADLYSIGNPAPAAPLNRDALGIVSEALRSPAVDWDRVLSLLRSHAGAIGAPLTAYIRGQAWVNMGVDLVALEFQREALRLEPSANYRFIVLDTMSRIPELEGEARGEAERIVADEGAEAHLLLRAATTMFLASRREPADAARQTRARITPALERALKLLDQQELTALNRASQVNGLLQLAACYDDAGRDGALQAYERALRVSPGHPGVLTARGVRMYARDTTNAVRDLIAAIRGGAETFWPHFFLAHYFVSARDYRQALGAATAVRSFRGLPMGVRGALHEFIAISQAELGEPPAVVRASFQQALEFAPDDERIRANHRAYERTLQVAAEPRGWEIPTATTVAQMAPALALAGA